MSTTQSSRGRAGQRENSSDEKHALQGYARTVGSSMGLSNTRKCAYGGQKPAGQEMNNGVRPTDIGPLDKSSEDDEDFNTVQHRQRQRSSQKPKQESDGQRKPSNAKQQLAPWRHVSQRCEIKKRTETKQSVLKKKRLVDTRCDRSQVETAKLVDSLIHHQTLSSIRDCTE